ncbi:MAG: M6 family metalloprotease domain-containing protein, partial [Verrucomicrobia bacterium]|nr:M6 family metalloprotease domain-containing protein [Verrucomicrobiota bacterium]
MKPPSPFALQQPWFMCFLMALTLWLASTRATATTASPTAVELAQPDGTKLALRIRGDEYFHWYEDGQGFTVVRDAAKQYVYANLDGGGRLAPTALLVGKTNPKATGLTQGILPTPAVLESYRTQRLQRVPPVPGAAGAAPQAGTPPAPVPPQGTVKNLVVLCKFADHATGTHTRTQADFDTLFNTVGGHATIAPSGSVKDYYSETSYGVLNLQSTVVAWVTLPQTESYYADGKDGTDGVYPKNAQGMVKDALDLVDPLVNFGQFDQDNDGYIDSITIIHSGYGSETGGGGGNWIWSHRWSLWALPGGQWTSQDTNGTGTAVKVYDYHTEPALWGTSGTSIVRIGVICHETGHFFGLPDLYDTDGSSEGIGSWCLMANSWGFDGSQLHPPHFSAWCKAQLGWLTPTVIAAGTYPAPQVETNPTVYKITTGFPTNEYLLIENRQPAGVETAMPQGGLAVWHIDLNKANNNDEGYPGQSGWPTNNSHFKIALLQADGLYEMEKGQNRGNAGDVYRGGGVSAITPATVPNTNRYQGGVVASSNNSITAISASGATMSFTLNGAGGVPIITSATAATAPPGLAFSYQIVATDLPTSYNASGLPTGLTVNTTTGLIYGTPNVIGNYSVGLSATNRFGTGTTTLALSVAPVLTLADALDTTDETWTTGGNSNWTAQTATSHDGQDAAKSGVLGNSQLGYLETTITGPGSLSFWWSVSSESGYDYLRFTVDGVEPSGIAGISGTVAWQQRSVSIASGSHTLRWQYSKDGSVASGSDAGWVDQVLFIAGVQPPVITSTTTASGALGLAFNYQITATNIPTSFGASGLPGGLTINTGSGLIAGTPTSAGTFSVGLSATNSAGTGTATLTLTISNTALTLGEAMDAPSLTWTVGGTSGWQPQLVTTHDGQDAAQSGVIDHSQNTWMETTVTGPGTLSFWWKVSSEAGYDYLRFTVDGVEQTGIAGISGTVDWQAAMASVGVGTHSVRWTYSKDISVVSGSDAGWVDQLVLKPITPVSSFFDDFDPSYDPALWAQFGGTVAANTNGQAAGVGSTGNSLWFGGAGSRYATTQPIDTRSSSGISFLFALANGAASPWEMADAGEEVVLEYSNDTTTFVQIGGPYSNRAWQTIVVTIPVAAQTIATQFRFWQLSNSGDGYDNWAIDDVQVMAPEIAVEQPLGTSIADGGTKDFGSVNVGSNTSLTFTIRNTGTASLTGLTITKDGTNAADFTVTSNPVAPVSGPSGTTTFTVQFAPSAAGARTAAIHIANNDADESPFDITLTGTGVAVPVPEIAVEQPAGTNIADGGTKDFGSVNVGSNTSLGFTIRNTGTASLTGLTITKDGTNAADFTVTSNPVAPVSGP